MFFFRHSVFISTKFTARVTFQSEVTAHFLYLKLLLNRARMLPCVVKLTYFNSAMLCRSAAYAVMRRLSVCLLRSSILSK